MLYRHKDDKNYIVDVVGKTATILRKARWQTAMKKGYKFQIDFDKWDCISFKEYLKKL